jgi:hypothetical protein
VRQNLGSLLLLINSATHIYFSFVIFIWIDFSSHLFLLLFFLILPLLFFQFSPQFLAFLLPIIPHLTVIINSTPPLSFLLFFSPFSFLLFFSPFSFLLTIPLNFFSFSPHTSSNPSSSFLLFFSPHLQLLALSFRPYSAYKKDDC